ncbi:hypothetical protein J7481_03220 [Labrenzia sp. R4_2]|uniref:hypothetical protein n=1 Tax=Labrenzia sp. R4_2 TaxID=2821107 RepID=UPI001ADB1558|nr:hypothetical protein [Labrenzia sp. R4_2]MBO9418494.1 hypothetical protein [Labrenzia sp. R4_2]
MIWSSLSKWLFGTRSGVLLVAAFLLVGSLYTWHWLDKSSAVRKAVVGYVAKVELAASRAELKVLKDRAAALEAANFQFQRQLQEAEALQTRQALELDTYESTVDAVVGPALIERLRNR